MWHQAGTERKVEGGESGIGMHHLVKKKLFDYRHEVTKRIVESAARPGESP